MNESDRNKEIEMVRCREWYRSATLDAAVAGLLKLIKDQYDGWTNGGDIIVTKKRTAGQTLYEASRWMAKAES